MIRAHDGDLLAIRRLDSGPYEREKDGDDADSSSPPNKIGSDPFVPPPEALFFTDRFFTHIPSILAL
jgi:hypothetical protein